MKHVDVVCALIYNKNREIFCCKRGTGKALEGYWEFPGGKIEPNESKEETIIREIKEELNSVIRPVKYIGKSFYEYTNIKPYNDFSITLYAYECELVTGNLNITEHTDSKWIKINELNQLKFAPADDKIISYLID